MSTAVTEPEMQVFLPAAEARTSDVQPGVTIKIFPPWWVFAGSLHVPEKNKYMRMKFDFMIAGGSYRHQTALACSFFVHIIFWL